MKFRCYCVLLAIAALAFTGQARAAAPDEKAPDQPVHPAQAIADQLTAEGVALDLVEHGKSFSIYVCLGEQHGNKTLAKVAGLPNVVSLDAGASKITDEGCKLLAYMPGLQTLRLYDTQIGDDTLKVLAANNRQLSELSLSNTQVTDKGAASLAALGNLRVLKLDGTAVTDAVFPPLLALRRLQRLSLQNTAVTAAAVADFEQRTLTVDRFASPEYLVVRSGVSVYYDKK
ncbi:leucine-rich repeat domain-containing protein [Lignipirellula cremea]|uniref:Leucine Rich repeats (2 copies) n=1 Tax=Lignipirellula cremea TaxID=2528010 RepID=A0A518DP15_9BACT|nr:hypothetical protein [Lignipirellula cremea]QDU93574.1 Leucine Rich repeats (2 copies) [Lignipirellula cremea]